MKIINNISYGLEWRTVKTSFAKTQAEMVKGKVPIKAACRLEADNAKAVGASSSRVGSDILSAAAICALSKEASATPNCAFVMATDEDGYFALIGLVRGLPTPGFDFVGSREEVYSRLQEFYAVVSATADITLYSDSEGDLQGAIPFSFVETADTIRKSEALKKNALIANLMGDIVKVGVVVFCFLLVIAGYFGFQQHQDYQKQQRQLAAAKARAAEAERKKNPEVRYKAALEDFINAASYGLDVSKTWGIYSSESNSKGVWRRVLTVCDTTKCLESWRPKNEDLVIWGEWKSFEGRKTFDFEKATVVVEREAFLRTKPEPGMGEQYFGNQMSFVDWVDKLESIQKGTLSVKSSGDISAIPQLAGKPSLNFREFAYRGPLWTATIPVGFPGMVVNKLTIETPNISMKSVNEESLGSLSIEGVFYEKN